jgi:hypothetical protein
MAKTKTNSAYIFGGMIIVILMVSIFVLNINNEPNCKTINVPYEVEENYTDYEAYTDQTINVEEKSQIIYDSTLQTFEAGGKLYADFTIKPDSKIKGSISTSKRSYFGITLPEECHNLQAGKAYSPGYIVQNGITSYNLDTDTSNWADNPTKLCLYVWDSDWESSALNSVAIKLTNYWEEETINYEQEQRPITKYRTVTKYREETACD